MYTRTAQKVKINFIAGRRPMHFIRVSLTLHDSWLEVKGHELERDYEAPYGSATKGTCGVIKKEATDIIIPEAAIQSVEIDNKKVDMRHFKKGY